MEQKNRFEKRGLVLSASLVAILVVLSLFNQSLFSPAKKSMTVTQLSSQGQARGIASVEEVGEDVDQAQTQWEYKLARQVAQDETEGARDMASIGQLPSPIEQFRFGLLENKYQFNFKDGKVMGLHFPETSPDRPKYINEGQAFLQDHAKLFAVNFTKAKSAHKVSDDNKVTETFDLIDTDSKVVGHATVTTDKPGRLLSLELNSL